MPNREVARLFGSRRMPRGSPRTAEDGAVVLVKRGSFGSNRGRWLTSAGEGTTR